MALSLIVGPGRVGTALALAESRAGREVLLVGRCEGAWQQQAWDLGLRTAVGAEGIEEAPGLLLFAVRDDALAEAIAEYAGLASAETLVAHSSGAYGVEALQPSAERGADCVALHPVMQFTEPEADLARMRGAPFTLAGAADAQRRAAEVVRRWGGSAVELPDGLDRRRYHLGLALASNHLTATLGWAEQLLTPAFGADARAQVARMAVQATESFHARGAAEALTGPVVRGDTATLRAHFAALTPEEAVRYAGLLAAVLDLAVDSGRLEQQAADEIRRLVAQHS